MAKTKQTKAENAHKNAEKTLVGTSKLSVVTRGRTFEGFVTKKFPKRVVVEFTRTVFVPKYERFYMKKTRLHARLPDSMANEINVGDYIRVMETRPLSKIIHFIVVGKVEKSKEAKK